MLRARADELGGLVDSVRAARIEFARNPDPVLAGCLAPALFVDGIHDDILTQLSKISAHKVISRTSVEWKDRN